MGGRTTHLQDFGRFQQRKREFLLLLLMRQRRHLDEGKRLRSAECEEQLPARRTTTFCAVILMTLEYVV